MKIHSVKQARRLLDESRRKNGFYQIEVVDALVEHAKMVESHLREALAALKDQNSNAQLSA